MLHSRVRTNFYYLPIKGHCPSAGPFGGYSQTYLGRRSNAQQMQGYLSLPLIDPCLGLSVTVSLLPPLVTALRLKLRSVMCRGVKHLQSLGLLGVSKQRIDLPYRAQVLHSRPDQATIHDTDKIHAEQYSIFLAGHPHAARTRAEHQY